MSENQLTSIANKVANIAFAGKVLLQRTGVYKRRAAKMKKLMLEAHNKGDRNEAYAYAMGMLMVKNHIKVLVDTAKKILYFVDFTISQLTDAKPPQSLVDLLSKFDESVRRSGVITYRAHLKKFEKTFDILGGDDDSKSKYPQLRETKLTRKNALAELKAATKNIQKAKTDEQIPRQQSVSPALQQPQG